MSEFKVYPTAVGLQDAKQLADFQKLFTAKLNELELTKKLVTANTNLMVNDLAAIVVRHQRRKHPAHGNVDLIAAYNAIRTNTFSSKVLSYQVATLALSGIMFGASPKSVEQKHKKFRQLLQRPRKCGRKLTLAERSLLARLAIFCGRHNLKLWYDFNVHQKASVGLALCVYVWYIATGNTIKPETLARRFDSLDG